MKPFFLCTLLIFLFTIGCKDKKEFYFNDFDADSLRNRPGICNLISDTANRFACTGNNQEFSYTVTFDFAQLREKGFRKARVSASVMRHRPESTGKLIVSLEPVFNEQLYLINELIYSTPLAGKWYTVKEVIFFPDKAPEGTVMKIYLWSEDKSRIMMNDLKIEFDK